MTRVFGREAPDSKQAAHELLSLALQEVYGIDTLPSIALTTRGKPWFPDCPDIHFNLSHSGRFALCAVGDGPVGVDVEVIRPRRELAALARRVFSPEELAWLEARGGTLEDFHTLWTRKEALVKYTGEGIAAVREQVPPLPGESRPGLWVRSWAGESWRAALCGEGEFPKDIIWKP